MSQSKEKGASALSLKQGKVIFEVKYLKKDKTGPKLPVRGLIHTYSNYHPK